MADVSIRPAAGEDLPQILALYAQARAFMRRTGNPDQWGEAYPPETLVRADIAAARSYLCLDGERPVGVFVFAPGPDPTYAKIQDGGWTLDKPYGVIHRVVSDGSVRRLTDRIYAFCKDRAPYLRGDTHRDNRIMQRAFERSGFERCGTIFLADESPRIAYEYIAPGLRSDVKK